MKQKIYQYDPWLKPYAKDIDLRRKNYETTLSRILKGNKTLSDFANGHKHFGFHKENGGWVYREWAPAAEKLYLTGDFCQWDRYAYPMEKGDNGEFSLFLPGENTLPENSKVMTVVVSGGKELERIPLYATYVVQEADGSWNGVIPPQEDFSWTDEAFVPKKELFIYECHIGMAQEEGKVGSYREFEENILPRVKALGYNTIQIMAIMEHPYYASFGYQVTNFFAPSSRFGTAKELKSLINTAHKLGIGVLLDVVHSHACKNTREGINEFDGTACQFFHEGDRGEHSAWGTKCFDYGKPEVLHFLLSNLKYWLTEFHFDGFRFDGVTSMLYHDHGLGTSFDSYDKYFSMNTDTQAVSYLQLATQLARQVKPHAVLIAEDMSGMPGMCLPIEDGGIGFDYRLAMGEPDMWIKLVKEIPDEHWDLGYIYYELTQRRPKEKVIGYCESHDQALVGDKTLMFRLCDREMYWGMEKNKENLVIDRGMALHKLIRLLTMSLGGNGYLTFMGNEFGHPEWIDFPREGNGWSYHYCRRQWSLADNPELKYQYLNAFEKAMVAVGRKNRVCRGKDLCLYVHNDDKTLVYKKGTGIFAFNFHSNNSYPELFVPVPEEGEYQVVLSSDDYCFGGQGRIFHQSYQTTQRHGRPGVLLYLPSRTAVVLKKK
ncbi:MAG: alpha amylase C-terminal domain-containing protein [Oscillospiraceae bacterium]|nr:alpha amylase C-terminal domain-containing protein [Oscillospiraceae bacterium]